MPTIDAGREPMIHTMRGAGYVLKPAPGTAASGAGPVGAGGSGPGSTGPA